MGIAHSREISSVRRCETEFFYQHESANRTRPVRAVQAIFNGWQRHLEVPNERADEHLESSRSSSIRSPGNEELLASSLA